MPGSSTVGVALHDVGLLVGLQADAVAGAVDELLAVPAVGDHLAGRRVDRLGRDPGAGVRRRPRAGPRAAPGSSRRTARAARPGCTSGCSPSSSPRASCRRCRRRRRRRSRAPGRRPRGAGDAPFGPEPTMTKSTVDVTLVEDRGGDVRGRPRARCGRAAGTRPSGRAPGRWPAPARRSASTSSVVLRIRRSPSTADGERLLGARAARRASAAPARPTSGWPARPAPGLPRRSAITAYGSSVSRQPTTSTSRSRTGDASDGGHLQPGRHHERPRRPPAAPGR